MVPMEFISEVTFDVKPGKTRDFQEWIRKNEDTIRKETPRGWEYIGTYAVIFSSEPRAVPSAVAPRQLRGHGPLRGDGRHHDLGRGVGVSLKGLLGPVTLHRAARV